MFAPGTSDAVVEGLSAASLSLVGLSAAGLSELGLSVEGLLAVDVSAVAPAFGTSVVSGDVRLASGAVATGGASVDDVSEFVLAAEEGSSGGFPTPSTPQPGAIIKRDNKPANTNRPFMVPSCATLPKKSRHGPHLDFLA